MAISLPTFVFSTTAEQAASDLSSRIVGKTVLITGISKGGLGFETARVIGVYKPKLLILAGRNASKNEESKSSIQAEAPDVQIKTLELDLGSFEAVRKSADTLKAWEWEVKGIDILINNAAVMVEERAMTVDGIEQHFATNHLAPFLFTNLIMDLIFAAGPGARIVNVSSRGHAMSDIRYDDYNWEEPGAYQSRAAYGHSKTGNILFSISLAEKLREKGILSFSLHPGGIPTNISSRIDKIVYVKLGFLDENFQPIDSDGLRWKNIEQGASTTIVAAFDPRIEERNGFYLNDCKIDDEAVKPYAVDGTNAEKLWKLSERLVGQEFSY